MKRFFIYWVSMLTALITLSQTTFTEGGINYMEDLSDPSKLAVIVIAKKSPLLQADASAYKGNVVIPSKVKHDLDEYEVIGIAQGAFMAPELESLVINEGPTKIYMGTIWSDKLKKLIFPKSVKSIEYLYLPELEEISADGVEIIKNWNFGKIESLNLPSSKHIINSFFGLKNIILGPEMDIIKDSFSHYKGEILNIPPCKEIIDSFESSIGLNKLTFSGTVDKISNSFNYIVSDDNLSLSEVLFLSNVNIIDNSFNRCINLRILEFDGEVKNISNSFSSIKNLENLNLPSGINEISNSFEQCGSLRSLNINNEVTKISGSFSDIRKLDNLTLPSNVVLIENSFSYPLNLQTLILNEGIKIIKNCFHGLEKIENLELPSSLHEINNTFNGINILELRLPKDLKVIEGSFNNMEKLQNLYVEGNIEEINDSFKGLLDLKNVYYSSKEPVKFINVYDFRSEMPIIHVPKGSKEKYHKEWREQVPPHLFESIKIVEN